MTVSGEFDGTFGVNEDGAYEHHASRTDLWMSCRFVLSITETTDDGFRRPLDACTCKFPYHPIRIVVRKHVDLFMCKQVGLEIYRTLEDAIIPKLVCRTFFQSPIQNIVVIM